MYLKAACPRCTGEAEYYTALQHIYCQKCGLKPHHINIEDDGDDGLAGVPAVVPV